jgi:ribosomal protein S17E
MTVYNNWIAFWSKIPRLIISAQFVHWWRSRLYHNGKGEFPLSLTEKYFAWFLLNCDHPNKSVLYLTAHSSKEIEWKISTAKFFLQVEIQLNGNFRDTLRPFSTSTVSFRISLFPVLIRYCLSGKRPLVSSFYKNGITGMVTRSYRSVKFNSSWTECNALAFRFHLHAARVYLDRLTFTFVYHRVPRSTILDITLFNPLWTTLKQM